MSLSAFHAVTATPPPKPGIAGPPRFAPRGPRLFFWLLLGAFAAVLMGVALLVVAALSPKHVTQPSPAEDDRAAERARPPAQTTPARERVEAPARQAAAAGDPPLAPAAPAEAAPAAWPAAWAFTERCKAPGGGCAEPCRPLAGGKCLDPCFIHAPTCSRDCLLPGGACGWPPPDTE